MNSVKMTLLFMSSHSSVDTVSTRRSELMGLIPVGDSDFFFVPRSCHVNKFIYHNDNVINSSFYTDFLVLERGQDDYGGAVIRKLRVLAGEVVKTGLALLHTSSLSSLVDFWCCSVMAGTSFSLRFLCFVCLLVMCAITVTFLIAFDNGNVVNSFRRRLPQTLRQTLSQTVDQTMSETLSETPQGSEQNVTEG